MEFNYSQPANGAPHPALGPRESIPVIPKEQDVADSMSKKKAASKETQPIALTASGRPKRICRFPGCTNSIKSHGHCQTHGAKPKRCKVEGCQSQRQSGFDDMCKRHWSEIHKPKKAKADEKKVEPQGKSVYDEILPGSFWYKNGRTPRVVKIDESKHTSVEEDGTLKEEYEIVTMMPLAKLLEDNASAEAGWHRKAENLARGIRPPTSLKSNLDEWETQLAIIEMALLIGIEEHSSGDEKWLRLLAHAWGKIDLRRNLVKRVCSRRGDLSRKRRSDTGTTLPEEKRVASAAKANATKAEKRKKRKMEEDAENEEAAVGNEEADDEVSADEIATTSAEKTDDREEMIAEDAAMNLMVDLEDEGKKLNASVEDAEEPDVL